MNDPQGRSGFRRDWEPVDARPLLVEHACQCAGCREHSGFWRDVSERLEYEHAVETHAIQPAEGPLAYAARISGIAAEMVGARGRDRELAKLRAQARGLGAGVEDYA
jgi:hypothetical protein